MKQAPLGRGLPAMSYRASVAATVLQERPLKVAWLTDVHTMSESQVHTPPGFRSPSLLLGRNRHACGAQPQDAKPGPQFPHLTLASTGGPS